MRVKARKYLYFLIYDVVQRELEKVYVLFFFCFVFCFRWACLAKTKVREKPKAKLSYQNFNPVKAFMETPE